MVRTKDIVYAVTKKLYENFPSIPIYALENSMTIKHEEFYVELTTLDRSTYKNNYNNKVFQISIKYYIKDRSKNLKYHDMTDQLLDEVFIGPLHFSDRAPLIKEQEVVIIEDVLNCSFQIEFIDSIFYSESYELLGDLRSKLEMVEKLELNFRKGG